MEREKNQGDWQLRAAKLFCVTVILLGGWLLLRYARTLLVVLLLVWGVSAAVDALARRTERLFKIPRKLCAVIYVILLLLLLGLLIFFALNRLVEELEDLILWMEENGEMIGQKLGAFFESAERFSERLPFMKHAEQGSGLSSFGESLDEAMSEVVCDTLAGLGDWATGGIGRILRGAPKALITVVVTVMACFYLSMDYEGIRDALLGLLPQRSAEMADRVRKKAAAAVCGYLRAYLFLFLLTFFEVFVGLMILGRSYALLLALLVALVDILPILGAGTVLVPWAIVMLILKNYYLGVGLLILFGVITIVRQIAEPHIVGGSLGLPPLASLFSLFAGLQLFGFWGMILGPAIALIVKEFLTSDSSSKLSVGP